MDTLQAIATRHSIRRFTNQPVEDEALKAILYAGFAAPTAHNRKPVHLVVIDDEVIKDSIANSYRYGSMLKYAPLGIVVCVDTETETDEEFQVADASAATQNMLLAIHSLELGGVWCGVLKDKDWYAVIKDVLHLPENLRPISLIALGHTDKLKKENRTERLNESFIHRNILKEQG
mgnify:CR=1 FL=1